MTSAKTQSRAQQVAEELDRRIHDDGLRDGEPLGTKQDLRILHDVSPGTLNEAVRLLEQRGRVRIRPGPGGGVFVASPSAAVRLNQLLPANGGGAPQLPDGLQLRDALEPLVAEEAARHRGDGDIDELGFLLERMGARKKDPRRYLEANWALHRRIAEISPNPLLTNLYRTLVDLAESHLEDLAADDLADIADNFTLHARLVESIVDGDPAAAAAIGREHGTALLQWWR